jgi:hypothetical protein
MEIGCRIISIGKDDTYYWNRAELIGQQGQLSVKENKKNGWYSGTFLPENGLGRYLYRVRVKKLMKGE